MPIPCLYCSKRPIPLNPSGTVVRFGSYRRQSDQKLIKRFRCLTCKKTFSEGTIDPCYRQKKRQFNKMVGGLLVSGNSQRRISLLLNLNRKTVVRKFIFLGFLAKIILKENLVGKKFDTIEFDEMESFEHTQCKPLSIPLAVDSKTRRILSYSVARMPAKGRLAKISLKKYGRLPDERIAKRALVLNEIKPLFNKNAHIKSDKNPFYPAEINSILTEVTHLSYKGQRGSSTGQGELKKGRFDPIFSINHTYAMLRANINRLYRKTWCTTKKAERLDLHIALYAVFHNEFLINKSKKRAA